MQNKNFNGSSQKAIKSIGSITNRDDRQILTSDDLLKLHIELTLCAKTICETREELETSLNSIFFQFTIIITC